MTSLTSLPNAALFRQLAALVDKHRGCTADIVEHLAEIDARRGGAARVDVGSRDTRGALGH